MPKLFVSYSRVDREFTERLVDRLRRVYAWNNVWYDDELHGGVLWWTEILRQIAECDIFIYLLSNESVTSPYCKAEFTEAQRLQKPVITIQIRDKTRLSDDLQEIQHINMLFGINDDSLARLIGSIQKMAELPKKKRALWTPATPLPSIPTSEDSDAPPRDDIETPTLKRAAPAAQADRTVSRAAISGAIIMVILGVIVTVIAAPLMNPTTTTPVPSDTASPTSDPPQTVYTQAAGYDYRQGNGAWTPVTQDFDGVTMMLVPPGCFMMGSDNGESDERPVSEQCFDEPFWIDKTEVTQAQFARFGGTAAQASQFSGEQRPRENVTWFEVRTFCEQRGGARLPTEAEWEYAARGPDALRFPWGQEWSASKVVQSRRNSAGTADVGSIPEGASWVGALDLSGNVSEWGSSLYQPYRYDSDDGRELVNSLGDRVLRGGSWQDNYSGRFRGVDRGWSPRGASEGWIGFRCVRPN